MTRNRFFKLLSIGHALLLISAGSRADMIELQFTVRFGAEQAIGDGPWLTAEIDSGVDDNFVRLTVSAADDVHLGEADITELYLNLDPELNPTLLLITRRDDLELDDTIVGTIDTMTGINEFRAGGDGYYDIRFDLPTGVEPNDLRLNSGETVIFDIEYTGDLTDFDDVLNAEDFYFMSAEGGGEGNAGPFLAAAHIQSTGTDLLGSDWVAAVPIPAAIWLFASSLGMLGVAASRRRRAQLGAA